MTDFLIGDKVIVIRLVNLVDTEDMLGKTFTIKCAIGAGVLTEECDEKGHEYALLNNQIKLAFRMPDMTKSFKFFAINYPPCILYTYHPPIEDGARCKIDWDSMLFGSGTSYALEAVKKHIESSEWVVQEEAETIPTNEGFTITDCKFFEAPADSLTLESIKDFTTKHPTSIFIDSGKYVVYHNEGEYLADDDEALLKLMNALEVAEGARA